MAPFLSQTIDCLIQGASSRKPATPPCNRKSRDGFTIRDACDPKEPSGNRDSFRDLLSTRERDKDGPGCGGGNFGIAEFAQTARIDKWAVAFNEWLQTFRAAVPFPLKKAFAGAVWSLCMFGGGEHV